VKIKEHEVENLPMTDDRMHKREAPDGRRSLWSRIVSSLRTQRAATRACTRDPAGQSQPVDDSETLARSGPTDRFASQLFASLLLELPEHRQAFTSAWLANDHPSLAASAHRLAGAVAYCDLPELSAALAGLERALREGDDATLQQAYNLASRELDALLENSGQGRS
jgi:HPt (histidine-containing phosphotransfer) domain-containing protein